MYHYLVYIFRIWPRPSFNCCPFTPDTGLEFFIFFIVKDTRAARPYLFSDGQNMYHGVVLVCTVNVYIPASLVRRSILRYQVLQVPTKLYSPYSLRTDSYVSCREYCKQFEINTARHLLLAIFIARHFKYRKQKTQPYLQSEDWFVRKL